MAIEFKNPKEYLAELIGTAILISIGCTVATTAMGGSLMTACGFALTFVGLIYCIGEVCDCHFNPLITLGMFINGKIDVSDTLWYILAQILGGILGSIFSFVILTQVFYSGDVVMYASTFGDGYIYGFLNGIDTFGAIIVEFLFAFTLVFITMKATESKKIDMKAGIVIAVAMFALIYFGCAMTNTAVNPAKSIGAAFAMMFSSIEDKWDPLIQLWLFIIFPILGAVAAGFLYMFIDSGDLEFDKIIEKAKANSAARAERKAAEAERKAAEEEERRSGL